MQWPGIPIRCRFTIAFSVTLAASFATIGAGPDLALAQDPAASEEIESLPQKPATMQRTAGSVIEDLELKIERERRKLWTYVFPAYLVIWVLLFGYLVFLRRRQAALDRAIRGLEARLAKERDHR